MKSWIGRRRFLQLLGVGGAAASCEEVGSQTGETQERPVEYIVVGSGAGGGPLACNLARQGHHVVLLEAGDDQGKLVSQQVPALHVRSTEEPAMRWDYFVKHWDDENQAQRDSKFVVDPGPHHESGVLYPRAGTLGGCTAHHAMITVYPHQSDWDHIADVTGDDSWRAGGMRRYFERLENCQYIERGKAGAAGHGFGGWLSTNMADASIGVRDLKLLKIIMAAAKALGLEAFFENPISSVFRGNAFAIQHILNLLKRDLNTGAANRDTLEGMFGVPLATDGQKRRGPREFILDTIAQGFPLTLKTNVLATRVLFEPNGQGPVARGVEYLEGPHLYRADPLAQNGEGVRREVFATREVILAAGAFNTPQLLKLSGVGPREELERFGIDVLVDLPGVGTNLQDRYEVGIVTKTSSDFSAVEDCTFGELPDPCLDEWEDGDGPYTSNGAVAGIVLKSATSDGDPDLFVFGLPGNFRGYEPNYGDVVFGDKRHFTWAILKGHTRNTAGTVTLRSTDPRDVPDIRFRYFDEGTTAGGGDRDDLDAMIEGVELVRRINDVTDDYFWFQRYDEVWPGPAVSTRDQVANFVRDEAWGHHASCTCPIGADDDPNAVLDSRFRVRGTQRLRVVDASVFPKIPGFFIVVPIYMISEKAVDVLLEDIGEAR